MARAAVETAPAGRWDHIVTLGLAVGVVLPLISALLYPTYIHQMQPSWVEWTRLMELPFVAGELLLIHLAIRAGYSDGAIARLLPRDVIVAGGLLLIGLSVSSIVASKNVSASLTLSLVTLIHLRFCAATFFLARSAPVARCSTLLPLLGAGLVLLTVLTAWKFLLPPPASSVPGGKIEWSSALPGFISVRHFGSWTGAIAAGAMVALLYGDGTRSRTTDALYLLAAGLTCWSGTRAAVLAMAIVAVIAVIGLRRLPQPGALVRVALLTLLAFGAAIVLAPAGQSEFQLFQWGDVQSADAMASGRLELWHATLLRWLAAPLFGWGSGSTFWEVDIGWAHTQPHNAILQFLISWGIVGASGALWLLGRAIVATYRTGMDDPLLRPIVGMLYALLAMSMLEGMLHYPRFIISIMLCFAVLLAARQRDAAAQAAGHPGEAGVTRNLTSAGSAR